jgi:hypothetical protein
MSRNECYHFPEAGHEIDAVCEACGDGEWGCTDAWGYRHLCESCFVALVEMLPQRVGDDL